MSGTTSTPPADRVWWARTTDAGAVICAGSNIVAERSYVLAGKNVVEITEAQYTQIHATPSSTFAISSGALTETPAPPTPLATLQAQAAARIDAEAETARLRFITPGAGQAMVYQIKAAQADAFLKAYPDAASAANAAAADWPLLGNEVGLTASSLFGVAQAINALQAQWTAVATQIEALRLGGKAKANTAPDAATLAALFPIAWPAP